MFGKKKLTQDSGNCLSGMCFKEFVFDYGRVRSGRLDLEDVGHLAGIEAILDSTGIEFPTEVLANC